jgi:hypothetical protein
MSNVFKNIKLFNFYKKRIKTVQDNLKLKYNVRIDKADRMYTVLNIPENLIGEAYSLKRSDIERISQTYLKEYVTELGIYLDSIELKELHKTYTVEKVGKYSFLLVFGFSLFKSHKYYNFMYYVFTPLVILGTATLFYIYI